MTNTDLNLNNNQSSCIQAQNNIGSISYHNICTGEVQPVPWGAADWAGAITLTAFIVAVVFFFSCMFKAIRDI